MYRQRITVINDRLNVTERLELCRLLIKAGYAAKIGKEKPQGKTTYEHYIEFWEE